MTSNRLQRLQYALLYALMATALFFGESIPGVRDVLGSDAAASGDVVATSTAWVPTTLPHLALVGQSDQSLNWSGYVAQGGPFTAVSGSWVVPRVTSSDALAADATWVGIGGVENHNLIQAGTQAIVEPSGHITYEAWLEKLPDDSMPVPLAVHPGDHVRVSLAEQEQGTWRVSIVNDTTGKAYSTTTHYDSVHTSAEWIEEMPSADVFVPLDTFGTLYFDTASAVEGGKTVSLAEAHARPLSMVTPLGDPLATPSVVSTSSSFLVKRSDEPALAYDPWSALVFVND